MKSAILYATTKKPLQSRVRDYTSFAIGKHGAACRIWVRAVIVTDDVAGALNRAKPRLGEIVLNSIPLP